MIYLLVLSYFVLLRSVLSSKELYIFVEDGSESCQQAGHKRIDDTNTCKAAFNVLNNRNSNSMTFMSIFRINFSEPLDKPKGCVEEEGKLYQNSWSNSVGKCNSQTKCICARVKSEVIIDENTPAPRSPPPSQPPRSDKLFVFVEEGSCGKAGHVAISDTNTCKAAFNVLNDRNPNAMTFMSIFSIDFSKPLDKPKGCVEEDGRLYNNSWGNSIGTCNSQTKCLCARRQPVSTPVPTIAPTIAPSTNCSGDFKGSWATYRTYCSFVRRDECEEFCAGKFSKKKGCRIPKKAKKIKCQKIKDGKVCANLGCEVLEKTGVFKRCKGKSDLK